MASRRARKLRQRESGGGLDALEGIEALDDVSWAASPGSPGALPRPAQLPPSPGGRRANGAGGAAAAGAQQAAKPQQQNGGAAEASSGTPAAAANHLFGFVTSRFETRDLSA